MTFVGRFFPVTLAPDEGGLIGAAGRFAGDRGQLSWQIVVSSVAIRTIDNKKDLSLRAIEESGGADGNSRSTWAAW